MVKITWNLYENGELIATYPSHKKAKKAMYHKIAKSIEGKLGLHYEVKKIVEKPPKETPQWKKVGFKSYEAWWDWYEEMCEDIHMGLI